MEEVGCQVYGKLSLGERGLWGSELSYRDPSLAK
jgi:hypothetical protein